MQFLILFSACFISSLTSLKQLGFFLNKKKFAKKKNPMCPIRPGLATSKYHPRLVQIEILKTSYTLQGNQQYRRNIMLIHLKFIFFIEKLNYLTCNVIST